MSKTSTPFRRPRPLVLAARLAEPRRFIQAVAGPRHVGKSRLVRQATADYDGAVHYASADEPTLRGAAWIAQAWGAARQAGHEPVRSPAGRVDARRGQMVGRAAALVGAMGVGLKWA
jgi:hypothetical protein